MTSTKLRLAASALLLGTSSLALAEPTIVQPGAPGEAPRVISAEEATRLADTSYAPGDVFNPQAQTQVTWPAELVEAAEASRKGG